MFIQWNIISYHISLRDMIICIMFINILSLLSQGVIIDHDKLTWNNQIDSLAKKINSSIITPPNLGRSRDCGKINLGLNKKTIHFQR